MSYNKCSTSFSTVLYVALRQQHTWWLGQVRHSRRLEQVAQGVRVLVQVFWRRGTRGRHSSTTVHTTLLYECYVRKVHICCINYYLILLACTFVYIFLFM